MAQPKCKRQRCKGIDRTNAPLHLCPKHAKEYADRKFAAAVRMALGGRCMLERCLSDEIQCAHIRSRRYLNTRWDFDNAIPLCSAHHLYFTHRPSEWEEFIIERFGQARWDDLRARSLAEFVPDWEALCVRMGEAS